MNSRTHQAVSLQQAAQSSSELSSLLARARDAAERLRAVQPLIPPALRSHVRAGPVSDSHWCLLVSNAAAAARLRYLLPGMCAHLRSKGWDVQQLDVRVLPQGPSSAGHGNGSG